MIVTVCVEDGERKTDRIFTTIDDAFDWLVGVEDGQVELFPDTEGSSDG